MTKTFFYNFLRENKGTVTGPTEKAPFRRLMVKKDLNKTASQPAQV